MKALEILEEFKTTLDEALNNVYQLALQQYQSLLKETGDFSSITNPDLYLRVQDSYTLQRKLNRMRECCPAVFDDIQQSIGRKE